MDHHLSLDIMRRPEVTTVYASGEIDMASGDHLRETLTELCVDAATVRLDMRDVSFIDSTGINVLVLMHRRSMQRGCRLLLSAPSTAVRRVLDYTGADAVLQVEDEPVGSSGGEAGRLTAADRPLRQSARPGARRSR